MNHRSLFIFVQISMTINAFEADIKFNQRYTMMHQLVNLFHEAGMLAKIPRSGFAFLGSGEQSVAEHSHRTVMIGFVLAHMVEEPIDKYKLLTMCLLHDLPEARTGDLNYVNKKYVKENIEKALHDICHASPLGQEIVKYIKEFEEEVTLEAKLAHDADQLEMLLVLKQEHDLGNPRAMEWFDIVIQRLTTPVAKKLAEEIRKIPSDAWWIENKKDSHWIHGGKQLSCCKN